MKLIKLICPNCGANLEITTDNKEFTCLYCKTPILLDEEIIKVEHTIASSELTEKIKVANTHLYEFEDYHKAYEAYKRLSEDYPYEPIVWWELITSITQNFTKNNFYDGDFSVNINKSVFIKKCDEYFDKYLKVEKDEIRKEENYQKYYEYIEKIKQEKVENKKIEIEDFIKAIRFFIAWMLIASTILGILTYLT